MFLYVEPFGGGRRLSPYLIFLCPKCGSVRYAREGQRTAKCFECGQTVPLGFGKIRVLLRVSNAKDAVEAVKTYKMKIQNRQRLA